MKSSSHPDHQIYFLLALYAFATILTVPYAILYVVLGYFVPAGLAFAGAGAYFVCYLLARAGRARLTTSIGAVNVVGLAVVGDLFFGWESGCHIFVLCILPFFAAYGKLSTARKIGLCTVGLGSYMAMRWAFIGASPLISLPRFISRTMPDINIFVAFTAIAFVLLKNSAIIEANERLMELQNRRAANRAGRDSLTRLPNRGAAALALTDAVRAAREKDLPLVVAMADIDDFKAVNDTYGHSFGDETLVKVAAAMKSALRSGDIVGRWGGEEFLILLPGTSEAQGVDALERMRSAIQEMRIDCRNKEFKTTVTVGLAVLGPEDGEASLLERADRHLYAGKRSGKNRVVAETAAPEIH